MTQALCNCRPPTPATPQVLTLAPATRGGFIVSKPPGYNIVNDRSTAGEVLFAGALADALAFLGGEMAVAA